MEKQGLKQQNSNEGSSIKGKKGGINPFVAILILFVIGELVYHLILSSYVDKDGNPEGFLGIIHKGGVIVPFLITFLLTVLVFSIERFFIISRAKGTGGVTKFVVQVRKLLNENQINKAIVLCDNQKGSIGNVVKEGLVTYQIMSKDTELNKDQKLIALDKSLEEATTLEMPILEKNMTILATIASIGTLIALMGTVIGMIKSFFAMGASGGAPDAAQLSVGISEALVNTALGIGTSALAIISYNFFTSMIDDLTYKIDEVGMSIKQSFASHN